MNYMRSAINAFQSSALDGAGNATKQGMIEHD